MAQTGQPVPGFGNNGVVLTSFHTSAVPAGGVAVMPLHDGKTLISVGSMLVRHLPDGQLDHTYGFNGFSQQLQLGTGMAVNVATMQPNGGVLVFGSVPNGGNKHPFIARYMPNGFLDFNFGTNGVATLPLGNLISANEVAVLGDNKIILSGLATMNGIEKFYLVRLLPDGKMDPSFGSGGMVSYESAEYRFTLKDMVLHPDGRIVVAGISEDPTPVIRLAQFLPNGSPDRSFGGEGTVASGLGNYNDLRAIAIQPDGKIVAVGTGTFQMSTLGILRFLPNGMLDPQFGTAGRKHIVNDFTNQYRYELSDVIILPNGKILIGGSYNDKATIWQFASNGDQDLSFYGTGMLQYDKPASKVSNMAVYPDGRIGFTGYLPHQVAQNMTYLFARLLPNGHPDYSLANASFIMGNAQSGMAEYQALAVQPDGKILAAGSSRKPNTEDYDIAIARYHTNGMLDQSFGTMGKQLVDISTGDMAHAIALYPDGRIAIGGKTSSGGQSDFVVVRLLANGMRDNSFDGDGVKTLDFAGANDIAYSVLVQPDGKIIASGSATEGGIAGFALARFLQNGMPDVSFSADGKQVTMLGGSSAAIGAALQGNGKILLGGSGYQNGTNNSDFILTRYNSDGTLDASFGMGGIRRTDFGGNDFAEAMMLHNGRIYLGGYVDNNSTYSLALAQYTADGAPYTGFSGDGKHTLDINNLSGNLNGVGPVKFVVTSIAVQNNDKIVISGYVNTPENGVTAMARINPDGHLDATFGSNGGIMYGPGNKFMVKTGYLWNDRLYIAGSAHASNTNVLAMLAAGQIDPQLVDQIVNNPETIEPLNESVVRVQSNPSTSEFALNLDMKGSGLVQLRILDASGSMIEQRQNIAPNGTQRFGAAYRPGIYMAEITQGTEKVVVKLIKQ